MQDQSDSDELVIGRSGQGEVETAPLEELEELQSGVEEGGQQSGSEEEEEEKAHIGQLASAIADEDADARRRIDERKNNNNNNNTHHHQQQPVRSPAVSAIDGSHPNAASRPLPTPSPSSSGSSPAGSRIPGSPRDVSPQGSPRPVAPPRQPASYTAPAGATKVAGTHVRLGEDVLTPEARSRRMTLAIDLNEYKAQLEQNDLQTKKTQSVVKGKFVLLVFPDSIWFIFNFVLFKTGIRGLVSKKKKRFIDSKYDLDLAYITDRLIAMGFPSEGREGIIRNPMNKVQQFFEERHANHYKVYNLCSERTYKTGTFRAPVAHFGFDDHNPPTLELLDEICKDVAEWLEFDARNVAALHCKAGKGRTGTVICAYLSHRYMHKGVTSEKALEFFAERRTHNKKGVTIASQIRWVHYYYQAKRDNIDFYSSKPLFLSKIVLHGAPNIDGKGVECYFVLTSPSRDLEYVSKAKAPPVRIQGADTKHTFEVKCTVDKDVKLQFYKNDPKEKKEKLNRLFHVWFNTHFVEDNHVIFTLAKNDIDGIKKTAKLYPAKFAVEFFFEAPENN